jgi:hypothetical protein
MKTYFAYGSNLNERRFKARIKSAKFVSRATLQRHRLVFEKRSTDDGSGKATVIPDDESAVEGAIFTYADEDHERLRKCEGGYSESSVVVKTAAGDATVQTFIAKRRDSKLRPFDWYVRHIVEGGARLGLPQNYLAMIAATPADADANLARVAEEQAYLT